MQTKLLRIIDANLNRSREGLRVCEDIARFILGDRKLTEQLKRLRHAISNQVKDLSIHSDVLLDSRDIYADKGRSIGYESKRKNYRDLLMANFQRAKESLRVLEEVTKLLNEKVGARFKRLRFKLYNLEKGAFDRLSSLRHIR